MTIENQTPPIPGENANQTAGQSRASVTQGSQAKSRLYQLIAAGFSDRDLRLIDIILRHGGELYPRFERVNLPTSGNLDHLADIVVANPFTVDGVKALARAKSFGNTVPTIHVVPVGSAARAKHTIFLERLSLQLIPGLNRIIEQEFESAAPGEMLFDQSARGQPSTNSAPVQRDPVARLPDFPNSLGLPDSLDLPASPDPAPELAAKRLAKPTSILASKKASTEATEELPRSPLKITADSSANPANISGRPVTAQPTRLAAEGEDRDESGGHEELPRQKDSAGPMSAENSSTPVAMQSTAVEFSARPPRRKDVLIVGIDPEETISLQRLLLQPRNFNMHCALAGDAAKAMAYLARKDCKLVLAKKSLLDASGFRLARTIRQKHPHIVVVLVADRASMLDYARASFAGCAALMTGPVSAARLKAAVRKPLQRVAERKAFWSSGPVTKTLDLPTLGQVPTQWLDTGSGR